MIALLALGAAVVLVALVLGNIFGTDRTARA